jgi:gluconate 5-dehydrogenase
MSLELFDLKGKVALVTGGTHGLGMAIATGLAKAGAKIAVNDIFQDKLDNAKKEYAANGIDVAVYNFDVTNEEAVIAGIAKIESEVGAIDILVNNAGSSSGFRWKK